MRAPPLQIAVQLLGGGFVDPPLDDPPEDAPEDPPELDVDELPPEELAPLGSEPPLPHAIRARTCATTPTTMTPRAMNASPKQHACRPGSPEIMTWSPK